MNSQTFSSLLCLAVATTAVTLSLGLHQTKLPTKEQGRGGRDGRNSKVLSLEGLDTYILPKPSENI